MTQSRQESALSIATLILPWSVRAGWAAIFALDARLGGMVASTREPMMGQLRLAWWREALERLDIAPAPAEPVLRDLAHDVLPHGVAGADLAATIAGWEPLVVAATLDSDTVRKHACGRGERVFGAAARLLGGGGPHIAAAGQGWACADLAARTTDRAVAETARRCACEAADEAFSRRWPRRDRPLGMLAILVVAEVDDISRWRSAMSVVRFRMTGRR